MFNRELGSLESEQRVEVFVWPYRLVGALFRYFLPKVASQVFGSALEDMVVLFWIFFSSAKHAVS
jgi:hypothetical protein